MALIVGEQTIAFLLVGVIFSIVGLFAFLKARTVLKVQIWVQKTWFGAKYVPSERTRVIVQIMGALYLIFGVALMLFYFVNTSGYI